MPVHLIGFTYADQKIVLGGGLWGECMTKSAWLFYRGGQPIVVDTTI